MKTKTCRFCGKEDEGDFVPKTNRCRKCDVIASGSRDWFKRRTGEGKLSRPIDYKKLVVSVEKKLSLGETEKQIIKWIRIYLPEYGNKYKTGTYWLYFFVLTNTEEGRKRITPKVMERLKELYNKNISARQLGRRSRSECHTKHPAFWEELEKVGADGKPKLRKRIVDSGA